MKRAPIALAQIVVLALIAVDARAAAPIVYPSQGQTLEQQASDEGACRVFAQQQSGFDPSMPPPSAAAPPPPSGQIIRGSARGAAIGAVGGAIGGDAGKGAAIGAGVGATAGVIRRGQQRSAYSQQQQYSQGQYDAARDTYMRGYAACMQGRGYSVR